MSGIAGNLIYRGVYLAQVIREVNPIAAVLAERPGFLEWPDNHFHQHWLERQGANSLHGTATYIGRAQDEVLFGHGCSIPRSKAESSVQE